VREETRVARVACPVCDGERLVTPEWPNTMYTYAKCLGCGSIFKVRHAR
jgi:ribosomal protein S27E